MAGAAFAPAWASPPQSQKAELRKLIMILEHSAGAGVAEAGYYASASLRTQMLLDDLLRMVNNTHRKNLKRLIQNYVADMETLQDDALINPQCLLYLGSALGGVSSLINTFSTSDGEPACVIADLVADVGGIVSALQSYRICEIVYSETPDQILCQQIVRRQALVKTCGYLAKVYCTATPSVSDYLSLALGLLGIFPKTDVCVPPVVAIKND